MTGDEVDEVVTAWARERDDLALEPMHIWSRIDRLGRLLADRRKAAFQSHDIEGWEFDVLAALRRAGEPHTLTPGQLLKETFVTSGTMTNRVDRLAARGLVTRTTDPKDRRAVLVAITPAGLALVDAALESLVTVERELLAGLGDDDTARLADDLRRLLQQD